MSKNEDGVTRVSQSKRRKLNTTDIKNNIECISDALLLVKTRMEDIIRQSCDQLKSAHQCIIEDNEKRLKNAATDGDSTKFGILLLKSLRDIDYTWSTFNETCIPDAMRKCNTELETIHRSLKKIAAYSENISNSIVDAGTDDGSIAIKQSLETLRGRIIGIRDSSQVCPAPVFTGIASSCGTHGGASGEAACHGRHTLPMKRIQQLYSIQHPRVSLYATEYDKVWCFDDIYWSHTPFLHCSIDAELGSCMDRFGSITHFTALHVLHNMGFVAEDIAVVLPYIDNSFYYRVSQDSTTFALVKNSLYKCGLWRGTQTKNMFRDFIADNIVQIFDPSVNPSFDWTRKYANPSTRVDDNNDDSTSVYSTIIMILQGWYSAHRKLKGVPLPCIRRTYTLEEQFTQQRMELGMSPAFIKIWCWPVVMRRSYISHVKTLLWKGSIIPPTPSFLFDARDASGEPIHRKGEKWDILQVINRWIACRSINTNETTRLSDTWGTQVREWIVEDNITNPVDQHTRLCEHDEIDMESVFRSIDMRPGVWDEVKEADWCVIHECIRDLVDTLKKNGELDANEMAHTDTTIGNRVVSRPEDLWQTIQQGCKNQSHFEARCLKIMQILTEDDNASIF